MKRPVRENTYRLRPLSGTFEGLWQCEGVGGCGGLVIDRFSHQVFHDLAESEVVRSEKRLRDLEGAVERLTHSSRLPRRGR